MTTTTAICEDNEFVAQSIEDKLHLAGDDIQIKYHANNGRDLLSKLARDPEIDVILMDIEMPVMDGIAATELVTRRFPSVKVIMLTVFDDDDKIIRAIQAGAKGYLLKDEPPAKTVEGIRMVVNGEAAMSPGIAAKTLQILRNREPVKETGHSPEAELSSREIEILEYLKQGFGHKEIAEILFIAPATVRKHIEHIYQKLQVHNKIAAVLKAARERIIN